MSTVDVKQQKVNFFFVGVGKCGTSWIFEIARKKKLFSVPKIKETYLIDQPVANREKLTKSLYQSQTAMADFSNVYYWDVENPQKIFDYNPDAKIIITVRKPSRRIISHFKFMKRNGHYQNLSLAEYFEKGDELHFYQRSIYRPIIQRYEEQFGKENVLILPLELLKASPQEYLDRLTKFCCVETVELEEEDKQPVLKQSKARFPIISRLAKSTASTLRRVGMLQLLAKLKDSSVISNVLYKENAKEALPDNDFGPYADRIADLDSDYPALLASYGLSINSTSQPTS